MNFFRHPFFFGGDIKTGLWTGVALLLLRLHVGVAMASAGMDKLPVPEWLIEQVAKTRFPSPHLFALLASLSEFAGGALLALGLFTRPVAILLAFTMAVAAFLFHQVNPITDLHITQSMLWAYFLFAFGGAGRFSVDHWMREGKNGPTTRHKLAWATALAFFGYGLFVQGSFPSRLESTSNTETVEISSVNLVGTFNEWNLEASPMSLQRDGSWRVVLPISKPGLTEFKFTANGSWDMNVGVTNQENDALPLRLTGTSNQDSEPGNIKLFIPMVGDYQFTIQPADFSISVEPAVKETLEN